MKKPLALIGCECSDAVTDAFQKIGFDARSCDLKPSENGRASHIVGDVVEAILSLPRWDFIGLHPDCSALAVSGNGTYAKGKEKYHVRLQSLTWTVGLYHLARSRSDHGYLENPRGILSSVGGLPPSQSIQPYDFGEDASKTTCLWSWGVPPLKGTSYHPGKYACPCGHTFEEDLGKYGCPNCEGEEGAARLIWGNQTASGQNKLAPGPNRKTDRARTYPGISDAFADQWGLFILNRFNS